MMLKERFLRAGAGLRRRAGELLEKPAVILALECAARFALTLLLSRAKIFGSLAPFGAAMLAASGAGVRGVSAMAGALSGYLLMGGLDWGLKYAAMCLLILSAAFIFRELDISQKSFFAPAAAAFTAAVTGFVYLSEAGYSLTAVVFYITETVLVGGCTLFYTIALSPWDPEKEDSRLRHSICLLVLAASALIALSRLHLAGIISIGRCGALLLVMLAARQGGMGSGAAFGVALGLSMDAAQGRSVFFSMVYGFAGLISGAFFRQKRLLFTLACILGNLIAALWAWDSSLRSGCLYEMFIASVFFMVLPENLLLPPGEKGRSGAARAARRAGSAAGLRQIAAALQSLYSGLRRKGTVQPNDEDPAKLFVQAAALTCRDCRRAERCWQQEHGRTMDALTKSIPAMQARGRLELSDLPAHFTENCLKPEAFAAAANESLRAALYRRQCRARLEETRAAAAHSYQEAARILESAAERLSAETAREEKLETRLSRYLRGMGIQAEVSVWREAQGRLRAEISGPLADFAAQPDHLDKLSAVLGLRLCRSGTEPVHSHLSLLEAEPLAVSVGSAAVRKRDEHISGDSQSFFKTEAGNFFVLLSDGMGSGESAARLSREAVRVLERFLRAGMRPEGALRLLSSAMLLQSEDCACTTADILCADLFSGKCSLYKCGAAPSYVRWGRHLRKIGCKNNAVGLGEISAERADFELPAGALVVMLSDGVLEGGDDRWLRDKICAFEGTDVKALAAEILSAAMDVHGGEDDMTVLCLLLSARE